MQEYESNAMNDDKELIDVLLDFIIVAANARHRYLWTIGSNGVVKNPTWSEWSLEYFYVMQLKFPFVNHIGG